LLTFPAELPEKADVIINLVKYGGMYGGFYTFQQSCSKIVATILRIAVKPRLKKRIRDQSPGCVLKRFSDLMPQH
jgi:hypothetical protein